MVRSMRIATPAETSRSSMNHFWRAAYRSIARLGDHILRLLANGISCLRKRNGRILVTTGQEVHDSGGSPDSLSHESSKLVVAEGPYDLCLHLSIVQAVEGDQAGCFT